MTNSVTPICPVYSTETVNQSIPLGRDTLRIECEGEEYTCPGEAVLQLKRNLCLTLNADFSSPPLPPDLGMLLATAKGAIKVHYGSRARPVNALLVHLTSHFGPGGSSGTGTFIPNPERLTICDDRCKRLAAVTFHVMNFPAFLSQGPYSADFLYEPKGKRLGRAVLEHDGWQIELQTLPTAGDLIKQLRAEGGFAITHVGRLTHKNGSTFQASQAEEVLKDLHLFLSFARGLWVPLVLPVGEDEQGNRVFESWDRRLATAWEPRSAWFDERNGQTLAELFPGFINLLHDSRLGEAVRAALYWYLRSNRPGEVGVDSGVILSQAALERLTTAYLPRKKKKRKLAPDDNATCHFRRAFLDLGIPTDIPTDMEALSTGQSKHVWKDWKYQKDPPEAVWTDLPEAVVKVRNDLVHAEARLPMRVEEVVADAWQSAQWYIELTILALAGYRGDYSNRLRKDQWVGEVQKVPWAR